MDIKDIQSGGLAKPESTRDVRATTPSTPPPSSVDQPVDRVTMSDQAQALQQLRLAALAVPEVRMDRVEALRRQLASGKLRPDPHRIAQALLSQGIIG